VWTAATPAWGQGGCTPARVTVDRHVMRVPQLVRVFKVRSGTRNALIVRARCQVAMRNARCRHTGGVKRRSSVLLSAPGSADRGREGRRFVRCAIKPTGVVTSGGDILLAVGSDYGLSPDKTAQTDSIHPIRSDGIDFNKWLKFAPCTFANVSFKAGPLVFHVSLPPVRSSLCIFAITRA